MFVTYHVLRVLKFHGYYACAIYLSWQLADADDSGGIDLNEFRQLFALLSVISGESVNDGTILGCCSCWYRRNARRLLSIENMDFF